LIQKSSRIKVYNALALPILYGSEILTLRQKDEKRLAPTEMKFFRGTAGYTLFDFKRDEEILEDLKVEPVDEKTEKIQIKFATTCNVNVQQQDVKSSAEL